MKKSPQEQTLLKNMGPSKFSAEGFIGHDSRPIDEIISADLRKLDQLGISIQIMVEALESAYQKAKQAMGGEIKIQPGVFASFFESRGKVPSPFKGEGVFEKGETVVCEKKSGQRMIITQLGIALIKKHHFFQGVGSRYRVAPELAAQLLALIPPSSQFE